MGSTSRVASVRFVSVAALAPCAITKCWLPTPSFLRVTGLVYFKETTGDLGIAKSLATQRELTQGVLDTIRISQIVPGEVGFFVHGGTTVINVITERKGAKTALISTAGFRDVLEIARGN